MYTVNFKILFQQLCIDKMEWDIPLYGGYLQRYGTLVKGLNALNNAKNARCLFDNKSPVKAIEIHGRKRTSPGGSSLSLNRMRRW